MHDGTLSKDTQINPDLVTGSPDRKFGLWANKRKSSNVNKLQKKQHIKTINNYILFIHISQFYFSILNIYTYC